MLKQLVKQLVQQVRLLSVEVARGVVAARGDHGVHFTELLISDAHASRQVRSDQPHKLEHAGGKTRVIAAHLHANAMAAQQHAHQVMKAHQRNIACGDEADQVGWWLVVVGCWAAEKTRI